MVGTLEPGTTGNSGDDAARHEHAPSRPEVTVVPRAHRQLSLHGSHHVNDSGAAADFGCGIGTVSPDNAVFVVFCARSYAMHFRVLTTVTTNWVQ